MRDGGGTPGEAAAVRDLSGDPEPLVAAGRPQIDKGTCLAAKDDFEAALSHLRSRVGIWDDSTLEKFAEGRREAVCALEEIARLTADVRAVAELLLRLASVRDVAEPCSAKGVFSRLFAIAPLSPAATKASADERAALLAELLGSDDKRRRLLALDACDTALNSLTFIRTDCRSGLVVPCTFHDPITDKEAKPYRKILQMLLKRVDTMAADEGQEAARIIVKRAVELSRIKSMTGCAFSAVRLLCEGRPADRANLVREAEAGLGACAGRMSKKTHVAWRSHLADMGSGSTGRGDPWRHDARASL